MADKLTQLRSLYSKMPDGDAKKAVATKIAKLEASQPKEVVEVKEQVKETITKPKATKSASGKDKRHVFEKQVEGGKEVKVVMASSADLAKEAMQESGFEFVKTITRGRSPKEGFIPSGKVKKTKGTKRASKATRDDMAKEAGMTPEKAEKVSEKVAKAKKRGRKPMDKQAYLFEMPLKTQAGKVKRKVVTATSEASAKKSAGKNYTLVKELTAGENPKVGVQPIEGFVAPEPKKRGRKPKAKTLEEVTEKSEAIGEGIGIADEVGKVDSDKTLMLVHRELKAALSDAQRAMEDAEKSLLNLQSAVDLMEELPDIVFSLALQEQAEKKMAHGGTTHEKIKISDSDMKKLHEGKEVTIAGVTLDFAPAGKKMAKGGKLEVGKNYRAMFSNKFNKRVPTDFKVVDKFKGRDDMPMVEIITENGERANVFEKDLKPLMFAKGGRMKRQGFDDELDESLGMRRGKESRMRQSMKDRRDESAGMEKSMGRRKYSSVGTMDIDDRMI